MAPGPIIEFFWRSRMANELSGRSACKTMWYHEMDYSPLEWYIGVSKKYRALCKSVICAMERDFICWELIWKDYWLLLFPPPLVPVSISGFLGQLTRNTCGTISIRICGYSTQMQYAIGEQQWRSPALFSTFLSAINPLPYLSLPLQQSLMALMASSPENATLVHGGGNG